MSNKVTVHIMGKEYNIKGDESVEYMHRVALFVNQKMTEIHQANKQLDNNMLYVLTAINLADEYLKIKDDFDSLKKEFDRLRRSPGSSGRR